MSKNITGATTLQWHDFNLFNSISKFEADSSIASKLLITFHKRLYNLILKYIFYLLQLSIRSSAV